MYGLTKRFVVNWRSELLENPVMQKEATVLVILRFYGGISEVERITSTRTPFSSIVYRLSRNQDSWTPHFGKESDGGVAIFA